VHPDYNGISLPHNIMPHTLDISPFADVHHDTPIEELLKDAAATCDEYASDIYDVPFRIESFAINSIAWFRQD
jgi:hypothetical protein